MYHEHRTRKDLRHKDKSMKEQNELAQITKKELERIKKITATFEECLKLACSFLIELSKSQSQYAGEAKRVIDEMTEIMRETAKRP